MVLAAIPHTPVPRLLSSHRPTPHPSTPHPSTLHPSTLHPSTPYSSTPHCDRRHEVSGSSLIVRKQGNPYAAGRRVRALTRVIGSCSSRLVPVARSVSIMKRLRLLAAVLLLGLPPTGLSSLPARPTPPGLPPPTPSSLGGFLQPT